MNAFLIALQFLTRFHVARQTVWTNEDFGRSVVFFPLVGSVIGLFLWLVYGIAMWRLPGLYSAVLVVAAWFFITGGLHADGLMDTADGIFSGRSRERMLEILKDSRVGANGVIAFFFLASFKICFLASLPPDVAPAALVGIPAAARFGTLISIFQFPYVRKQGLGQAFIQYAPPHTAHWAFILALGPILIGGWWHLVLLGAAMLVSLGSNIYIARRLGGVTGDTYGAVLEISETALLGVTALWVSFG